MSPRRLALLLALLLLAAATLSLCLGTSEALSPGQSLRGALAAIGLGDPLEPHLQLIARLRLLRVVVGTGVGAALALSGALLQGVFRNDLASPSILGLSAGASLGAACVILVLGGASNVFVLQHSAGYSPLLVTCGAFVGAGATTWLVLRLATTQGRISIPTLLLVGVAVNAVVGGVLTALQALSIHDYDVSQALFGWMFGRIEDKTLTSQITMLWVGLSLAAVCIPFVAIELDLLAGGEEDALALGVDVTRVKRVALGAAALSAAVAVSVAGQIGFVGLVAPHLIRRICGNHHRPLLGLCLLGGPTLLLGADVLQRWLFADRALGPGVAMSLLGGPFFLFLLVRNKRALSVW